MTTAAAAAATKSFHIELLKKLKKTENLNNISFHRVNTNNSKMEQLFDCSSINSSCSSSSNAHTPTRDTLKANETQVKSANSVTFKTKTNNNKSTIISNTPSATVTKQLNRTNTVSAASIRYSKMLLIIITLYETRN